MDKRILGLFFPVAAFAAVFMLYLNTMHPVFKNNDSPETVVAGQTLGIGHSPAYPLYTMMSKIFTLLNTGNPAFRVNLLALALSLLLLFQLYRLSMKVSVLCGCAPGYQIQAAAIFTVMALAFSRVFWSQAIEAKGGIYMLNLVFFTALLHISFNLLERFRKNDFYMAAFIFGLSLANHWPSMIILAPVALYFPVLYHKRLKPADWAFVCFFMLLGASAYLYLPIRAAAHPILNWGDPSDWAGFMWVVLRKGYVYAAAPSFELYRNQVYELLSFIVKNCSFFIAFSVLGGVVLHRKSAKHVKVLAAYVLLIVFFVVFYNRTQKELLWIMDIFLMPAQLALLLLSGTGLLKLVSSIKNQAAKAAAFTLFLTAAFAALFVSYPSNNNSRDFLSYDYGNNILLTLKPGSLYLADGDYNAMPIFYLQEIEKKRSDVRFATASFFIFNWGINGFYSRNPVHPELMPNQQAVNLRKLVDYYSSSSPVYRSNFFAVNLNLDQYVYRQRQDGIAVNISRDLKAGSNPRIFEAYSYRGVYEDFTSLNKNNRDLAAWYPVSMVNEAGSLLGISRFKESVMLNKKALLFPGDKPEGNILYNMSIGYSNMSDDNDEIKCLILADQKGADIPAAYQRLGVLYYKFGMLDSALSAFLKADYMGDKSEITRRGIEVINSIPAGDRMEFGLLKASEKLLAGDLEGASIIYDFLLEKHYKNAIIYKNLGVYHFKTSNIEKALDYFVRSENETPDAVTSLYKALALFKLGRLDEAIKDLNAAVIRFPQDKSLADLINKLKENQDNGKSTHSVDRQGRRDKDK